VVRARVGERMGVRPLGLRFVVDDVERSGGCLQCGYDRCASVGHVDRRHVAVGTAHLDAAVTSSQRQQLCAVSGTRPVEPLAVVLRRLNPVLRGWANYFRHRVSKATFDYLSAFSWRRVICWLRHKHRRANCKWIRRRYLPGWRPTEVTLFNPTATAVTRYRYRGGQIPTPWTRAEATVA
jgi:RNA-directed DNA polymerase